MRLKEIKPGMAIYCTDIEQVYELNKQMKSSKRFENFLDFPCYIITDENGFDGWIKGCNKDFISVEHYNPVPEIVNFTDLILPELTAEELFRICGEICKEYSNKGCNCKSICPFGFHGMSCTVYRAHKFDEVKEICAKWKSDHDKKEPEIETEWFWQGRIFQIKYGGYYQIKEDGTGFYDTGCEYRESAEEYMKDELKEYCKTHEGEFIAVVEHVCRVKAVK